MVFFNSLSWILEAFQSDLVITDKGETPALIYGMKFSLQGSVNSIGTTWLNNSTHFLASSSFPNTTKANPLLALPEVQNRGMEISQMSPTL
jgi:hypothetical protein